MFIEGVGDVFEEDEAEDHVLTFRRVQVFSQLVGGVPELRIEADSGGGIHGFRANHGQSFIPGGVACR